MTFSGTLLDEIGRDSARLHFCVQNLISIFRPGDEGTVLFKVGTLSYNWSTIGLKFGSVQVQKHTGCLCIIFSFCTCKYKFWFAGTIYSNLYRHSVQDFRDAVMIYI